MPLGLVGALSSPGAKTGARTVLSVAYRYPYGQEVRERRQVMPTWAPTTDQKSLNKRVTAIGSNQFETSSIPI